MKSLIVVLALLSSLSAEKPEWCRKLPRPAYRTLERIVIKDPWFEVYKIRPGVFAIYEPHQSEEVISYLVLGTKSAVLFDTGMGISNIRAVVEGLTGLPVSVINSHTHDDHVGDNWRFNDIYGMDTDFTRANAKGSREDAQAEIAPGEVCGNLPPGFNAADYATKPFHISHWMHDHDKIDLGGRILEVISTPGHTPDAIALLDEKNGAPLHRRLFLCRPHLAVPAGNRSRRIFSFGKKAGCSGSEASIAIASSQHSRRRTKLSSSRRRSNEAGTQRKGKRHTQEWQAGVHV